MGQLFALGTMGVIAGIAHAGVVETNPGVVGPLPAEIAWADTLDDHQRDGNESAVANGDYASLSLYMYVNQNLGAYVNSGGEVEIQRNLGLSSLGMNSNRSDTILASWEENVGQSTNTVQVVWKTLAGGELIPDGTKIQGEDVQFIGWRVGAFDPVTFRPWVTQANLISVTVGYSIDSGATINYFDITPSFNNPWDGTDFGKTLPFFIADGANYLTTVYEFTPIPAPGALAIVGLAALGSARRCR